MGYVFSGKAQDCADDEVTELVLTPQIPMKVEQLFLISCGSPLPPSVLVRDIKVGKYSQLAASESPPALAFGYGNTIHLTTDTVQISEPITVHIYVPKGVFGIRLHPVMTGKPQIRLHPVMTGKPQI